MSISGFKCGKCDEIFNDPDECMDHFITTHSSEVNMTTSSFGDLLKKAEESGASFEVLEAGKYAAKIIESNHQPSSNNKPQIKTRWEVIAGPKAGFKGLWNYFTLTTDNPNALAIFYRQMQSLGITTEFLQTLASLDPDTAMKHIAGALLGRAALIDVVVDTEWNNNKIKRINPLPPEYASMTSAVSQADPFAQAAASVPAPPAAPIPTPTVSEPSIAPVSPAPPASAPNPSLPAPPF
jgi:hypothetical protein